MNNTILIECNNLASQKTQIYQENNFLEGDSFNKELFNHRWKTKLPNQITLQPGDQISVEKAMINSKGQSDETIEMTQQAFVEGLKDNEAQMEFGYYINNNMDFNLTLPKIDIGNKTIKDNLQTLTEFKAVAVEPPAPVIRSDWIFEKSKLVVPEKKHKHQVIQYDVFEEVYNWNTEQTGDFYINSQTNNEDQPFAFIRKYGSPMFRGTQADYYHLKNNNIEVDKTTSIYKLTEHAPIHKLGYNESTCSTNHILLNKPDSNTRFYIGKRNFDGFYDDDNFDIKKARTTLKLPTGFNNPVVISKQLTTQLHQQVSDDFNEPFEMLNYSNSYKTENVSDNCMKIQTTFAGNIFQGQNENDDKYNFKLPNQNSIASIYDKPDVFRYANREDCENVFWNQLLVGDVKRSIAISKFYGGITSINPIELHFDDDYLSKNYNVFSGLNDILSRIKKFDEYNADEQPFDFGIQPVIFDDLSSFSIQITNDERLDPKNSYFGEQKSILEKEDLLYLDNSSTKLNLEEGDCIPTNLLATQDNFNRIEQLLRNMEKPSENDLDINLNNQEFKDSLDFHLEYNRIDDKETHHVLSGIWYKSKAALPGGFEKEDVFEPDINTIQKNAFPRIYNLPSPKMTLDGINPTTSYTNYLKLRHWNRMPILLGQYIDFPENFTVDKIKSEIASDRLRVNKIEPVSINTFSRYSEKRSPINNNLRLPTNNFSFKNSKGEYFDDTEIRNKDLGIAVAYRDIVSSSTIEEAKVGSYTKNKNVESITATDTLPYGKDEKMIGADAFNPYGETRTIYGDNNDDLFEPKFVHKSQVIDFTGENLSTLYAIDNGSLSQGTTFSNFLSDNTTDYVSIDTDNGNALSDTNKILLKITIPPIKDLNNGLGANITHVRLYIGYDSNSNIDGTNYAGTIINMTGMPTKVRILGQQVGTSSWNELLAEKDLKDKYLQKTNSDNLSAASGNFLSQNNIFVIPTNLQQTDPYLKPYIELDVRNENDYNKFLRRIQFEFTENANSKYHQRIIIKRIEYIGYNETAIQENIRSDILFHVDDYSNLKLDNTDNLKDGTISNQLQINYQANPGSGKNLYGVDILRELYPTNQNLQPLNISNDELDISLANPYEENDVVEHTICGMGKPLNEVESIEPSHTYGGVFNTHPSDIDTLPHPNTNVDNALSLFSPISVYGDDANSDLYRFRTNSSEPLPHFINFTNDNLKDKRFKLQKFKIVQAGYYTSSSGGIAQFVNSTANAPRVFAIFGSNKKPDNNPRCAFGMNLVFCTATNYSQFISSLTLQSGVSTTSTLTGFTNQNPDYIPFLTTNASSNNANKIYHLTRASLIVSNDNEDSAGFEFTVPTSNQGYYKYYRILLFDNQTTSSNSFAIGNMQLYGARKNELGVRAKYTSSQVVNYQFTQRSIKDYSPQLWINSYCDTMNRELANGFGIRRHNGYHLTGPDSSGTTLGNSVFSTPLFDSDGDPYIVIGDNNATGSNAQRNIFTYQGSSNNWNNRCSGSMNTGVSYTFQAWIDVPNNITKHASIYGEYNYNYRRTQFRVAPDGAFEFVIYQQFYTNSTDPPNPTSIVRVGNAGDYFGKYKLTIVRELLDDQLTTLFLYKDDVLEYTNTGDLRQYYYNKFSSSVLIGSRADDNNQNPANVSENGEWNLYGLATFNYAMTEDQVAEITKEMLTEGSIAPYREIDNTTVSDINNSFLYDHSHLLTNDLEETARFSLGNYTSFRIYIDLQQSQKIKYLDIYPANNQSKGFPNSVNILASNVSFNDINLSGTPIGQSSWTNSAQVQTKYASDPSAFYHRISNDNPNNNYRYLIIGINGITGLTSGNLDSNYCEIAGIRIIGEKTLSSSDLDDYNKFYSINYTADNHRTGTIDKFVNGRNDFPNNALSFKYQFSNDDSEDYIDDMLRNGYKFFDYNIHNNALDYNFFVDLQNSTNLRLISLWGQANDNFPYPQLCDIYGSNDSNFTTETLLSQLPVSVAPKDSYTNGSNPMLSDYFKVYDNKPASRYLKFKFNSPRTNHLIELPVNKAGGRPGYTTGFTTYSSPAYGSFNNKALLSDGFISGGGGLNDIYVLDSLSNGFIAYEFTTEFEPTEYRIWCRGDTAMNQNPKSWEFRASASKSSYDSGTYDVLHSYTDVQFARHGYTNFTPEDRIGLSKGSKINTNGTKYRYYVIHVIENNGRTSPGLTTFSEFAVYGKTLGFDSKYKHVNLPDLRLGDLRISEYKGKQFEDMNETNNFIELVYTNYRSIQIKEYDIFPNNINATSDFNNGFRFMKKWKFYGSNDHLALVDNRDEYWTEIQNKENTNNKSSYDGNYTLSTIPNDLLNTSSVIENSAIYKYYKWRIFDRFEDDVPNSSNQPLKSPYINLGELRIKEIDRVQGASTDIIHQPINANVEYNFSPALGLPSYLFDDFGTIFKTSTIPNESKFYVRFEEDVILSSLKIWGSYNAGQSPTTISLFKVNDDDSEILIGNYSFTSNVPTNGEFIESSSPSDFPQYATNITITPEQIEPHYRYGFDIGEGKELTQLQIIGKRQEYNLLGSLQANGSGVIVDTTNVSTNLNNLFNNTINEKGIDAYEFSSTTDTEVIIRFDFKKEVRIRRYAFWFNDTTVDYLQRWRIWGSNTTEIGADVPNGAILLDDKTDQDYNPTYSGTTGIASDNLDKSESYEFTNLDYYRYYFLEAVQFKEPLGNPYISELAFYGNENFNVLNIVDNKLGQVAEGLLTDAWIVHKDKTNNTVDITITLNEELQFNQLRIWTPADLPSNNSIIGPKDFVVKAWNESPNQSDTIATFTNQTYPAYSITDILDADENLDKSKLFNLNTQQAYKNYVITINLHNLTATEEYVAIAEIAFYRAINADRKDVPFICFISKGKQDHNGALQLTPREGEMIGISRSLQNNKWGHIMTTKPSDLPQLATGIDGISYNNTLVSGGYYPFGERTLKDYNNNFNEDDPLHYSQNIMVGSENMNFNFDTDLARISIKEMNTAMQQGQNLSERLRYEDYRTEPQGDDIEKKDSEANTQVVKINPRKYSVNSAKYGSSFEYNDNNRISYRYPFNVERIVEQLPPIPVKTLFYLCNQQGEGIFSSQTGVGLLNIYAGKQDGSYHKLTIDNKYEYKNTLFDKLGFKLDQLISKYGNQNAYFNRHNQNLYIDDTKNALNKNNLITSPLTTNGYIDGTINTTLDSANGIWNFPMGKLGLVGSQTVNSSYIPDELIAKNKPSKYDYSHILLYTDIVPKYSYVGTNKSLAIPCVGHLDRQYQNGDFLFAEASSFRYTVDLPQTISEINVDLRLADGRPAPIDENSTIIFRIDKQRPLPLQLINQTSQK